MGSQFCCIYLCCLIFFFFKKWYDCLLPAKKNGEIILRTSLRVWILSACCHVNLYLQLERCHPRPLNITRSLLWNFLTYLQVQLSFWVTCWWIWKAGLLKCWSFSSRSHSHVSRKLHHRPLNGEGGNHAFISCQSGFIDLKWSPIIVVLLLLNSTIFQYRVCVCVCFLHFLFFMNAFFVAFHHFHSSTF